MFGENFGRAPCDWCPFPILSIRPNVPPEESVSHSRAWRRGRRGGAAVVACTTVFFLFVVFGGVGVECCFSIGFELKAVVLLLADVVVLEELWTYEGVGLHRRDPGRPGWWQLHEEVDPTNDLVHEVLVARLRCWSN